MTTETTLRDAAERYWRLAETAEVRRDTRNVIDGLRSKAVMCRIAADLEARKGTSR
jgi:hypothetical protein